MAKDWCLGCLKRVSHLLVIATDAGSARTGYCADCVNAGRTPWAGKAPESDRRG